MGSVMCDENLEHVSPSVSEGVDGLGGVAQIPRQGEGEEERLEAAALEVALAMPMRFPPRKKLRHRQTKPSSAKLSHTPKKMMMTSRAILDFLFLQLHTRLIHNAAWVV